MKSYSGGYEWEIAYLDDEKLVIRLTHGGKRFAPMIVFDTAQVYGWRVGDLLAVDDALHPARQMQKVMRMRLTEDDYVLMNQRTGTKANIRKNDFEVEDAWKWLEELQAQGRIK